MTTDSETTEQYLTFVRSSFFYICPSFCVTTHATIRTWNGVTLIQFANAFAIAITFARWRRRSEATAVTFWTNFLFDCIYSVWSCNNDTVLYGP